MFPCVAHIGFGNCSGKHVVQICSPYRMVQSHRRLQLNSVSTVSFSFLKAPTWPLNLSSGPGSLSGAPHYNVHRLLRMPLSRSMTTSLGLNGTGVLRLIPGQRSSGAFDSPSACTSAQVHAANTCAPVARGHRRARVPLAQLKSESRLVGMRRASLLLPLSPSRHVVTATHTDSTLPSCKYALAHSDIHDRIARP